MGLDEQYGRRALERLQDAYENRVRYAPRPRRVTPQPQIVLETPTFPEVEALARVGVPTTAPSETGLAPFTAPREYQPLPEKPEYNIPILGGVVRAWEQAWSPTTPEPERGLTTVPFTEYTVRDIPGLGGAARTGEFVQNLVGAYQPYLAPGRGFLLPLLRTPAEFLQAGTGALGEVAVGAATAIGDPSRAWQHLEEAGRRALPYSQQLWRMQSPAYQLEQGIQAGRELGTAIARGTSPEQIAETYARRYEEADPVTQIIGSFLDPVFLGIGKVTESISAARNTRALRTAQQTLRASGQVDEAARLEAAARRVGMGSREAGNVIEEYTQFIFRDTATADSIINSARARQQVYSHLTERKAAFATKQEAIDKLLRQGKTVEQIAARMPKIEVPTGQTLPFLPRNGAELIAKIKTILPTELTPAAMADRMVARSSVVLDALGLHSRDAADLAQKLVMMQTDAGRVRLEAEGIGRIVRSRAGTELQALLKGMDAKTVGDNFAPFMGGMEGRAEAIESLQRLARQLYPTPALNPVQRLGNTIRNIIAYPYFVLNPSYPAINLYNNALDTVLKGRANPLLILRHRQTLARYQTKFGGIPYGAQRGIGQVEEVSRTRGFAGWAQKLEEMFSLVNYEAGFDRVYFRVWREGIGIPKIAGLTEADAARFYNIVAKYTPAQWDEMLVELDKAFPDTMPPGAAGVARRVPTPPRSSPPTADLRVLDSEVADDVGKVAQDAKSKTQLRNGMAKVKRDVHGRVKTAEARETPEVSKALDDAAREAGVLPSQEPEVAIYEKPTPRFESETSRIETLIMQQSKDPFAVLEVQRLATQYGLDDKGYLRILHEMERRFNETGSFIGAAEEATRTVVPQALPAPAPARKPYTPPVGRPATPAEVERIIKQHPELDEIVKRIRQQAQTAVPAILHDTYTLERWKALDATQQDVALKGALARVEDAALFRPGDVWQTGAKAGLEPIPEPRLPLTPEQIQAKKAARAAPATAAPFTDVLDWARARNNAIKEAEQIVDPQARIAELNRIENEFAKSIKEGWITAGSDKFLADVRLFAKRELRGAKVKPATEAMPVTEVAARATADLSTVMKKAMDVGIYTRNVKGEVATSTLENKLINALNATIRDAKLLNKPFAKPIVKSGHVTNVAALTDEIAARADEAVAILDRYPETRAAREAAKQAAKPLAKAEAAAPAARVAPEVTKAARVPFEKLPPTAQKNLLTMPSNLPELEARIAAEQAAGKLGRSRGFTPTQEQYLLERLPSVTEGKQSIPVPRDGTITVTPDQADHLEMILRGDLIPLPGERFVAGRGYKFASVETRAKQMIKEEGSVEAALARAQERQRGLPGGYSDAHNYFQRLVAKLEEKLPAPLPTPTAPGPIAGPGTWATETAIPPIRASRVVDAQTRAITAEINKIEKWILEHWDDPATSPAAPAGYNAHRIIFDFIASPEFRGAMNDTLAIGKRAGVAARNFVLHDYIGGRYNFDTMLAYGLPFHFWMTREGATYLTFLLRNPQFAAAYATYRKELEEINKDIPEQYRDMLGITTPFGKVYFNIETALNPLNRHLTMLENLVNPERAPSEAVAQFMRPFPGVEFGARKLSTALSKAGVLPDILPEGLAEETGRVGTQMMQTAAIQAFTALLKQVGVNSIGPIPIPPGGINVEMLPFDIAKRLGLDLGITPENPYDPTRIGRQVVAMQQRGEITLAQAEEAMLAQQGAIWDKAKTAAYAARVGSDVPGALVGLRFNVIAPSEKDIEDAKKAFSAMYAAEDAGQDVTALRQSLQTRFPWYYAYNARYRDAPERAVAELRNAYYERTELERRTMRDSFGGEFYDVVRGIGGDPDPVKVAAWLAALGKLAPAELPTPQQKIQAPAPVPAHLSAAYALRNQMAEKYGGWDKITAAGNEYYALPQGSQARRDYLKQNPWLAEWWTWQRALFAQYPELGKLLGREEQETTYYRGVNPANVRSAYADSLRYMVERAQRSSGGRASAPSYVTRPSGSIYPPSASIPPEGVSVYSTLQSYIQSALEKYWDNGEPLGTDIVARLLSLWRKYGRYIGARDLQSFIAILKQQRAMLARV